MYIWRKKGCIDLGNGIDVVPPLNEDCTDLIKKLDKGVVKFLEREGRIEVVEDKIAEVEAETARLSAKIDAEKALEAEEKVKAEAKAVEDKAKAEEAEAAEKEAMAAEEAAQAELKKAAKVKLAAENKKAGKGKGNRK